ncbi:MAG TPA: hypothetical protein VLA13_09300 [Massilibacterium sp.]|nr:hypothetical protein [Massilibacterium sp.]
MDEKKKIIVQEILYWKENKLLPETYCNFLLALYSGGDDITKKRKEKKSTRFIGIHATLSFIFIALFIFGVLVIYFTDFSFQMQMTFEVIIILFFCSMIIFLKKYRTISYHIAIFLTALLVVIVGSEWITRIFKDYPSAPVYFTMIHCFIWIVGGKKFNILYLFYAGIGGMIVMLMILIYRIVI